jgi:hypothetical protein
MCSTDSTKLYYINFCTCLVRRPAEAAGSSAALASDAGSSMQSSRGTVTISHVVELLSKSGQLTGKLFLNLVAEAKIYPNFSVVDPDLHPIFQWVPYTYPDPIQMI